MKFEVPKFWQEIDGVMARPGLWLVEPKPWRARLPWNPRHVGTAIFQKLPPASHVKWLSKSSCIFHSSIRLKAFQSLCRNGYRIVNNGLIREPPGVLVESEMNRIK